MPILNYDLPKYPCECDVWDALKSETRPIAVYGMGNGADKLFERFAEYGISVSEIFASNGFVRGHSFRGYKVRSFSEIKERYSDFVIVLSFASNRADVVEMLVDMDEKYDMYIPDIPIANTEEYFDKDFYNKHYSEIVSVYDSLADKASKSTYAAVINYRLTGKMKYLMGGYSEKPEMYEILPCESIRTVVDAGAYNGDTAREAIEYFPNLEHIVAVEPDNRNFKKLTLFAEKQNIKIDTYNAAVWSFSGVGNFFESGNRNATAAATASHKHKDKEVELVTVDGICGAEADLIKYDVEGAELEALSGSHKTISESAPSLLVSLYHRSRDIFSLPQYISEKYPNYDLYIRRLYSVPAWEINLLAIAKH